MSAKQQLESYLQENKVAYVLHHHPVAYTAQDVAATEHVSGKIMAKVVMVKAGHRLVMLVVPASSKVNMAMAAKALGVDEVRLATEDEFAASFPNCEVGAMPPFGVMYHLPEYVDRMLAAHETVVFQAGTHSDTIAMRFADFERIEHPEVIELALAA